MSDIFRTIFILKDLSDDSLFKVKICKTKAKLEYNRGWDISSGVKVANTKFVYVTEETLGENEDIIYISDQSPLAKSIEKKNNGDIFQVGVSNFENCRYQLIDFFEIDENGNKIDFSNEIEYLKNRKIATLIHFTRIENVESIMKHGICPLNECQNKKIKPLITDEQRLDDLKDYSSFSVGFPNYKMRYSKEKENNYTFAIIVIDIDAIKNINSENIIFSYCNAASSGHHNATGLAGAKSLFYNENLREKLKLPDFYTTDPQAEILIKGNIAPKYLKRIFVRTEEEYQYLKSKNIDSIVDKWVFSPRHDYEYWQKTTEDKNG